MLDPQNPTFIRNISILVALSFVVCLVPFYAQAASEDKLKAAYLYNFTNYITWPSGDGKKTICVHGDDELKETLDYIAKQKGQFHVRNIRQVGDITSCHILFLGGNANDFTSAALKHGAILTVSDYSNFSRNGGVIEFVRDNDNIRLIVNTSNLEQAGLRASSKLLRIATIAE